ncbi:hypothetical protein [Mesonia mobilis]|uniref:Uncharacterized protein n=1 Tax=Mesonia mobilis TaxID=369791 RepID=A0ABQ3BGU1_9FLAO|nr:hypothetical protein [Mesonia mobilis]MBQ0737667.1 hypothetical protein [Aquimarina celericrescens]GGZ44460.1 hypothetical protein GCM10008088_01830 [Mesonia mobilis]
MLKAKVFRCGANTIFLTEDYFVFDYDKAIKYEHLLTIEIEIGEKFYYCLLGQYKPGYFFNHISPLADEMIIELLQKKSLALIKKTAIKAPSYYNKHSGEIKFDDGYILEWYISRSCYMKFLNPDRKFIKYMFFTRFLFGYSFKFIGEKEIELGDWKTNKNVNIVLFNPFDTSGFEAHSRSIIDFRKKHYYYKPIFNERIYNNPSSDIGKGCLIAILCMVGIPILMMCFKLILSLF